MPSFSIDNLAEFDKWLTGGFKKAIQMGTESAALRTVELIQNELIPRAKGGQPVDTSHYRQAWHVEPVGDDWHVVNNMPYASVIEYGAKAGNIKVGRAMISALTEWVGRKTGLSGNDARSRAWSIAISMASTVTIRGKTFQGGGKGIFNRTKGKGGLRIAEKAKERFQKFAVIEIKRALNRALRKR